jgi:hypothetical protein
LEKVTEGGHTGWALVGDDRTKKADIGNSAVDLSNASTGTDKGASGSYSFTSGRNNIASDTYAIAMGNLNQATATTAIAIGNQAHATGIESIALGREVTAGGKNSLATGFQTQASKTYSIAMGVSAQATDTSAIAIGNSVKATGSSSVAIGAYNEASGIGAVAMGRSNGVADHAKASGDGSFTFQDIGGGSGIKEVAANDSAIIGGKNNDMTAAATNSAIIAKFGFTATQPNSVYVPSLVIATGTLPTGEKGHLRVANDQLQFHNGTEFNRIPVVSKENTVSGEMKIAVVASMPATPDANTIYYVA